MIKKLLYVLTFFTGSFLLSANCARSNPCTITIHLLEKQLDLQQQLIDLLQLCVRTKEDKILMAYELLLNKSLSNANFKKGVGVINNLKSHYKEMQEMLEQNKHTTRTTLVHFARLSPSKYFSTEIELYRRQNNYLKQNIISAQQLIRNDRAILEHHHRHYIVQSPTFTTQK